jgi:hypothetical protein
MPTGRFLPTDELGGLIAIDAVHHMIHMGLHFTASQNNTLAASSALNVLITAPASPQYHFMAEVDVDAPATITFSKAPNATATGSTAIVAYNNNEDSANTSTLTHVWGGVYTSSGTVLTTYVIGSVSGVGANKTTIGGNAGGRAEIDLGVSSVHLLRVLPGAATCVTTVRMYYYRET